MILLLLFIFFQYSFQTIRSLCQEECEADVSIILRSRCQNEFQIMRSLCQEECEADIKINAKPMSRCASNLVLEQITGTHQKWYSR